MVPYLLIIVTILIISERSDIIAKDGTIFAYNCDSFNYKSGFGKIVADSYSRDWMAYA